MVHFQLSLGPRHHFCAVLKEDVSERDFANALFTLIGRALESKVEEIRQAKGTSNWTGVITGKYTARVQMGVRKLTSVRDAPISAFIILSYHGPEMDDSLLLSKMQDMQH